MDKIINVSLARKSVPLLMDVVQGATAPNIVFVLEDYTPPANARARIYIKKSNAEVYNSCTLSGNQITYTPTAGSFDEPGQCVAQLEIVQGNTVAVSWRIFVTVEPNLISGSAAPASTEYGALTDLIINAQKYDTIIGANNIVGANNRQGWTALTTGQDANNLIAPGIYYAGSNAIGASILNTPTTGLNWQFKLDVIKAAFGSNSYRQIITYHPNSTNSVGGARGQTAQIVFIRGTADNGANWSDWILNPTRMEVNAIANAGAKNLFPTIAPQGVQVINGIEFTVNADGSVTANGTATGTARLALAAPSNLISGKQYVLSGCPSGGSSTSYFIRVYKGASGSSILASDYGEGATVTADSTKTLRYWINIDSGTTVDNLTFYPMIRDASIQDDTYVPYGMSNAELTNGGYSYSNSYDWRLPSTDAETYLTNKIADARIGISTKYILVDNGATIGDVEIGSSHYGAIVHKYSDVYASILIFSYNGGNSLRLLQLRNGTWYNRVATLT